MNLIFIVKIIVAANFLCENNFVYKNLFFAFNFL